jgi:hypothetical protein
MKENDQLRNLADIIEKLQEATRHLKISLKLCEEIGLNAKTENALIQFEALTSRFARVTDILIHKVYRSIDVVEFVEGGTLIDVMNRADKRKLIDSIQEMRILKDLRNEIAHEYIPTRIQLIHQEVLELAPRLLELAQRAIKYIIRYTQ